MSYYTPLEKTGHIALQILVGMSASIGMEVGGGVDSQPNA